MARPILLLFEVEDHVTSFDQLNFVVDGRFVAVAAAALVVSDRTSTTSNKAFSGSGADHARKRNMSRLRGTGAQTGIEHGCSGGEQLELSDT